MLVQTNKYSIDFINSTLQQNDMYLIQYVSRFISSRVEIFCFIIRIFAHNKRKQRRINMTVFELMPTVWLSISFFFFISAIVFGVDLAAVGLSSSLTSFFLSALSLPIYIQCGVFFLWASGILIAAECGNKKTDTAVAVTKIDRFGGIIKYSGKCRLAYARDVMHEYKPGDIITVSGERIGFTD